MSVTNGEEINAFLHLLLLPLSSILIDTTKASFNTINGKLQTKRYQFINIET